MNEDESKNPDDVDFTAWLKIRLSQLDSDMLAPPQLKQRIVTSIRQIKQE